MAESTATSNDSETAKGHFAKAVEEALAGAQALSKEAQNRADEYREVFTQTKDQYRDRFNRSRDDLTNEARARSGDAKEKAYNYATDGKAKAGQAIASLGKLVEENAATIDDKVGVKYGDYARTAARSLQGTAANLDEKTLEDLGDDVIEFIREKPALAVGIAAAAGFMLARTFKSK